MSRGENTPLEVDVWNVIEGELNTGFKDVLDLRFSYSTNLKEGLLVLRHPENSRIETKRITLESEAAEALIIRLATEFNFHWSNLADLEFELKPDVIPVFIAHFYPRVSDVSTLDKKKNRSNPITID